MLLSFRFENFRSFKEEQELSMVAGSGKEKSETLIHAPGIDEAILPISATYGANASGKSNVLSAFNFMVNAVRDSHSRWEPGGSVPREPFAGFSAEKLSSFALDFIDGDIRYQYSFSVNDEVVVDEWLYAYPRGKPQMWFTRSAGKPIAFGEKLTGDNRVIENLTRPNSLFLSAAAQNNHKMLSPVYRWFLGSVNFILGDRSGWRQRTAAFCQNPENRSLLVQMLSSADLGIEDIHLARPQSPSKFSFSPLKVLDEKPVGVEARIRLAHRVGDKTVIFNQDQESAGTIAYLALLQPVITAIREGGIVCVDEIDASLHPNLALQLVRLFNDKISNPRGAQFIFSAHDTNFLSSGELRRDEVWFTEKNIEGVSRLYSLGDFKPRKEENLENGYLQGRFGAVPFMNVRKLHTAIGANDETA